MLGDVGCFSFNGNKLLTTGGGGMIVTDDVRMADRAHYLTTQAKDDGLEYVHREIGYNYRLSNIQAALGCAQMEQIEPYLNAKKKIAERYSEALAGIHGVVTMTEAPWARNAWWMYTIEVVREKTGIDSRSIQKSLLAQGIETRSLWLPAHQNEPYRNCEALSCEVSEQLYEQALCLPCSVGLSEQDQERTISCLRTALEWDEAQAN
jgi:perosamine synthetase